MSRGEIEGRDAGASENVLVEHPMRCMQGCNNEQSLAFPLKYFDSIEFLRGRK